VYRINCVFYLVCVINQNIVLDVIRHRAETCAVYRPKKKFAVEWDFTLTVQSVLIYQGTFSIDIKCGIFVG